MKKHAINILVVLSVLLSFISCKKDKEEVIVTYVKFNNIAINVAGDGCSAEFTGNYEYTGTLASINLLVSQDASMTEKVKSFDVTLNPEKLINVEAKELEPNATYYYCFEGFSGFNYMRNEKNSFRSMQDTTDVPVVRTLEVFEIGKHYAKANGEIIDDGGKEITDYGFCWSRDQFPSVNGKHISINDGEEFTATIESLVGNAEYHIRAYATNANGTGYGEDLSFVTLPEAKGQGALSGIFVINGKIVRFSQGLLQYNAVLDEWQFADEQYNYIGSGNQNISSDYDGWIDLYGWGTSGWNNRNSYYRPSDYQHVISDYGYGYGPTNGTNYEFNFSGYYSYSDWGIYNGVKNGGYTAGHWRTLTYDEFYFLLIERTNAYEKASMATVNGVCGFILLPDVWELPAGCSFEYHENATVNVYNGDDWVKMENAGAVFFPCSGQRIEKDYFGDGFVGSYWLNATDAVERAKRLYFQANEIYDATLDGCERYYGLSVRLVQEDD